MGSERIKKQFLPIGFLPGDYLPGDFFGSLPEAVAEATPRDRGLAAIYVPSIDWRWYWWLYGRRRRQLQEEDELVLLEVV